MLRYERGRQAAPGGCSGRPRAASVDRGAASGGLAAMSTLASLALRYARRPGGAAGHNGCRRRLARAAARRWRGPLHARAARRGQACTAPRPGSVPHLRAMPAARTHCSGASARGDGRQQAEPRRQAARVAAGAVPVGAGGRNRAAQACLAVGACPPRWEPDIQACSTQEEGAGAGGARRGGAGPQRGAACRRRRLKPLPNAPASAPSRSSHPSRTFQAAGRRAGGRGGERGGGGGSPAARAPPPTP